MSPYKTYSCLEPQAACLHVQFKSLHRELPIHLSSYTATKIKNGVFAWEFESTIYNSNLKMNDIYTLNSVQ